MSCGVQVPLGSECDPGTAKLEDQVVGALSSYSPEGVEVACISVSRRSPYPSVQTCGLGVLGSS